MSTTDQEPLTVLAGLIADIRFAMLTTTDRDGRLCSRPMTTQQSAFDGVLWFLTDRRTHPAEDIARHPQVNVSYVDSGDHKYVSITGSASLVDDRDLIRQFWQPAYAVWFPVGPADPNLILLRVQVERADYWDSPSSWAGRLLAFAKALATGDKSGFGTRGHIDLGRQDASGSVG